MKDRVRIGSLIHRNRAALKQADECLAEIAEVMPRAGGATRRRLRQVGREVRRTQLGLRLVGWVLRLLDTR